MKKDFALSLLILSALMLLFLVSEISGETEGGNPFFLDRSRALTAPDFTLKDLSGNDVTLSQFKGKHVLLNFWATWCGYCRRERPHLNALYEEFRERGLVVVAVSTDRSVEKVKKYMKKIPSPFIVLSDSSGRVAAAYGITGYPTSYLIDREGLVRQRFPGYMEWTSESLQKMIEDFLRS